MNKQASAFNKKYPEYAATSIIDTARSEEYDRLDKAGEVYLDYTGGSLYAQSQIDAHVSLLKNAVLGNPHSDNPSSLRSTLFMEEARKTVLEFFTASPDEYAVIFTQNASNALRLVAESYPFQDESCFLQLVDNHNSVNGIREFARKKGAAIHTIKSGADLRVEAGVIGAALANKGSAPCLFAYPAQSNFSGVLHSLDFIKQAQKEGWDVLLDAAAFVPTNRLDLSKVKPEFVALSFYKMFGWPTGVGCLLARKEALQKLRRPWFSGGTIWALSVQGDWHVMAPEHEAFEDGTVDYLNLPAVTIGLKHIQRLGVNTIHTRVMCLTDWVLTKLQSFVHENGRPLVEVYGPQDGTGRGATVAFNFLSSNGTVVDERIVSREAKKYGISLRTGCFCNPGSGETVFDLSVEKLKAGRGDGNRKSFDEYLSFLGLQSGGAIRISFGVASNFADAEAFLQFAEIFINASFDNSALPERGHC